MRLVSHLSTLVALAVPLSSASAATLLFDFGDPAPAAQSSGNVNNIVSNATGGSSLVNAVDTLGNATGIAVTLTDPFWPGSNQNGTNAPGGAAAAIFPATATRDNLFGSTVPFSGFTEPTGGYKITGLDPSGNTLYAFTFFGSRTGVTDNRETYYALVGNSLSPSIAFLDTANNVNNVATISGMIPNASGEIDLEVGPGPNNTNASRFYYIGAMQIVSSTVPEPTSLSLIALGTIALRRRR